MSFFLLSICIEELISTTKIIQFLRNPLPTENFHFLLNPIPYPKYKYLSISAFLVKITPPNKQFSNVRLLLVLNFFYSSHKQCICLQLFHNYAYFYLALNSFH